MFVFFANSAFCQELYYKYQNLDRLFYAFVDSILGIASVLLLRWTNMGFLHFWASMRTSIGQLEMVVFVLLGFGNQIWFQLISWLTKNPAGLKLNTALNTFLSNFFFYHVQLWKTYVTTALEHSHWVNWILPISGAIGLSVLIAFLVDFLRVLTVHIFCFHVYTHRLCATVFCAFIRQLYVHVFRLTDNL